MGDPRQRDVDESRALMELAEEKGAVSLPALSAAELCVLGAAQASLVDEDAWTWWCSMPELQRTALAAVAVRLLVHRKLLEPPEPGEEGGSGDTVPLRVRPPLGFIVAGRLRPAFVAVRRDGADAVPDPIRLYGIADESGLLTVLVEVATHQSIEEFGPGYQYILASPAGAVGSLLHWVQSSSAPRKVLDVYRPASDGGPTRDHVEIVAGTAVHRVERPDSGAPISCDDAGLGALLLEVLRGR
jgi:hypothetical protein